MKNKKLAIAIPTYNRAEIVKENLLYMMDDIKKYNIPIYISDDSNNDDTKIIISELTNDYEYIYYYKNEPSLGHDKNCLTTLSLADTDFVWYLGDSIKIVNGSLSKVLNIINSQNIDFVFVNAKSRDLNIDSGIKEDKNEILVQFGWHLTQTGSTIYSQNSIMNINKIDLDRVKNFPQFFLIFNFLVKNKKAYWLNDKIIFANQKKKTYWNAKVFEVFITDWENVVNFLDDSYLKINKKKCILKHSHKTKLFGFFQLLNLRANGVYDFRILKKYNSKLILHSKLPYIVLFVISIMPEKIFFLLKQLTKKTGRSLNA